MNRLKSLEWLRGLLALSIMIYHLTGWKLYQPDSSDVLGRLGVYGVSMFFVLSGLSMAAGYHGFVKDGRSALRFFIRRIFRIWPLLWIAIGAVTTAGVVLKGQTVDWSLVLMNVTTLFGFISPSSYINTGAWSIGNEMFYYALTPGLLALYDRNILFGNVVVVVAIMIGGYFGFEVLGTQATLASQWKIYINPLNNMYLYAIGVAMYYNTVGLNLRATSLNAFLLLSVFIFVWYPTAGDLIHIVTGVERVVFSLASVLLVFVFYKTSISLPEIFGKPLGRIGEATYGIYLLHPIVFPAFELMIRRIGINLVPQLIIFGTILLTIVFAAFIYRAIESPMIMMGKRVTREKVFGI